MAEPFSVSRTRSVDPALPGEIRERTGSDAATAGILRSIERFGSDLTILRYEVVPKATSRFGGAAGAVAWTVRAVRP